MRAILFRTAARQVASQGLLNGLGVAPVVSGKISRLSRAKRFGRLLVPQPVTRLLTLR